MPSGQHGIRSFVRFSFFVFHLVAPVHQLVRGLHLQGAGALSLELRFLQQVVLFLIVVRGPASTSPPYAPVRARVMVGGGAGRCQRRHLLALLDEAEKHLVDAQFGPLPLWLKGGPRNAARNKENITAVIVLFSISIFGLRLNLNCRGRRDCLVSGYSQEIVVRWGAQRSS